ncbi:hypothetical protein ACFV29_22110 [Streptomyces sp. NPDC059690]|uniref:hypothetical protein n=1 Tax=Streptomyces sp. NPDC059690 TaxID=3346907 RepID=UPI0036C7FE79
MRIAALSRETKADILHSDNTVSNLFLFQLQRHSDHHANPLRRYQTLRHFDEAPQLPSGYATLIVVAWFPPLWRRVMDHRLMEHYDSDLTRANLHPPLRRRLFGSTKAACTEAASAAAEDTRPDARHAG